MVDERRRSPREDLLSDLIAAEEEGDRLSTDELAMLVRAVLMAGTDTTRNQLGCAMALFARYPEQWALLVADPVGLAPRAVEETMRYLGAVRATVRVASCDVEFDDVVFPAGTVVTTQLAAANRDSAEFADPGSFDITAERSAEQLTFGSGIHRCAGSNLARMELRVALEEWLLRIPSFSLEEVLDGGLLLCRLPKGILGDESVRLMGSLLVAQVWQEAAARARAGRVRSLSSLYLDECQNFLGLPGSIADMLAEARGYGLGLVLAHQTLSQLGEQLVVIYDKFAQTA